MTPLVWDAEEGPELTAIESAIRSGTGSDCDLKTRG
jgi:hypothetical protein